MAEVWEFDARATEVCVDRKHILGKVMVNRWQLENNHIQKVAGDMCED